MKKLLVTLLAASLPLVASASCTWTALGTTSAKVVCTTGTETAPTAATDGIDLGQCRKGVSVFAYAETAGQTIASGTVRFYVYNGTASLWAAVPDLDLSVSATAARAYGFPGVFVAASGGRIGVTPTGVTVSSGNFVAVISCD